MNVRAVIREHRLATTVVAAVLPLVVAALLSLVRDTVSSATAVLVLVAFVVAAGATGIRAAGLAAAVSAVAWFDFFLTEPYGSFAISSADDLEAAVLLLVIGGIVTETALWGLRQEAALARQSGYLGGVLATAETLARHHESREQVTESVGLRITELLGLDSCRFVAGPQPDPGAPTFDHSGALVRDGNRLNVERDGLPVDTTMYLPVRSGGHVRGHFVLTAAARVARPGVDQRRVAALLADQVAGWFDGTEHEASRPRA
jgi:K+-sensing histidine kinase KdpD